MTPTQNIFVILVFVVVATRNIIIYPGKCIDHYTKLQQEAHDAKIEGGMKPDIDSRLEAIVNRMFDDCLESGQYKQAIGIAIETRRLDVLERAIRLTVNSLICIREKFFSRSQLQH